MTLIEIPEASDQRAILRTPLLKNVESRQTVDTTATNSCLADRVGPDSARSSALTSFSGMDLSASRVSDVADKQEAHADAKTEPKWLTLPLLMTVLSCTIGGSFQFGFAIGFVNNTAIYVKEFMIDMGYEIEAVQAVDGPFTSLASMNAAVDAHFTFWWSIAVSIFGCGAFFGSFFGPMASNHPRIGRRNAILLENFFFITSCTLLGFVPSCCPWTSLILGRFLVGVGSGAATGCVPLYVAEISPKQIRGTLGTVHQLLITIGILISQSLTTGKFHLLGSEELWQYTMLVPAICSLSQIFTLCFVPESPAYLYKLHFGEMGIRGREEARESLRFFRRGVVANEEELERIMDDELDSILRELTSDEGAGDEENASTRAEERLQEKLAEHEAACKGQAFTKGLHKPPSKTTISPRLGIAAASPPLAPYTANLVDQTPRLGRHGIVPGREGTEEGKNTSRGEQSLVELCFKSKRSVQMPILIGIIVNLTMQLSGMDAVLYYSTQVFLNAGIPLESAEVCTTLVGFVNFLVTIPAMLFMDVSGRKTIQLTGLGGMYIGYNLMVFSQCMAVWSEQDAAARGIVSSSPYEVPAGGFGAWFDETFSPIMSFLDYSVFRPIYAPLVPVMFYRYMAVFSMMWIVICFAFGPGCIAWFIIAELCPIEARATATSLGLGFNALANWAVAFFFPICLGMLGRFTFVIFVFFTALFWSLTNWFLIETKGKSPSEVEEYFRDKYD